jgi:C4-dicarboxylate transporter DctQ subunit
VLAETPDAAGAALDAAAPPAHGIAERALRLMQRVLALLFIAAVVLNFANVVGRYVFGSTIPGADELQLDVLIGMCFLGTVLVSARRAHLRMDLLAQRLPAAGQFILRMLDGLLVCGLCGFAAWQSTRYAAQLYDLGARSDDLQLLTWPVHALLALGLWLMALIALLGLFGRHAAPLPEPNND